MPEDYAEAIRIATKFEAMPFVSKAVVIYDETTKIVRMLVYGLDGKVLIQAGRLIDDAQAA